MKEKPAFPLVRLSSMKDRKNFRRRLSGADYRLDKVDRKNKEITYTGEHSGYTYVTKNFKMMVYDRPLDYDFRKKPNK